MLARSLWKKETLVQLPALAEGLETHTSNSAGTSRIINFFLLPLLFSVSFCIYLNMKKHLKLLNVWFVFENEY